MNHTDLDFTNKLNLKKYKTISLANLSIYYTWENIKLAYNNNNKFKISGPTWSETFDLPDGSYEISDIQDYFLKMIQEHEKVENNENSPALMYTNNVRNRLNFKLKTGYKLELLTKETQKLLGDGSVIDKDKNSNNVPQLDQVEYVLLHCNLVENDYLQNSKLLYEFVPDKKFGQLISVVSPVFI